MDEKMPDELVAPVQKIFTLVSVMRTNIITWKHRHSDH